MNYYNLFAFTILSIFFLSLDATADSPIVRTPQGKFPATEFSARNIECDSLRNNSERAKVLIRTNPLEIFQMNQGSIEAYFHGGKVARNAVCQGKITKNNTSRKLVLNCREKVGKYTTDTSLFIDLAAGGGRIAYSKKGQVNFNNNWILQNCE